jgi:hypothetical protein
MQNLVAQAIDALAQVSDSREDVLSDGAVDWLLQQSASGESSTSLKPVVL